MFEDLAATLIKEARAHARMSQEVLAIRSGVPRSVISAYENSRRQPSVPQLAKILRAAGGFRLELRAAVDIARNARRLHDVLNLSDALPKKAAGKLVFPALSR